MCVGVESSKRQCEWCRQWLQVFANREMLLGAAMRDGMDPTSASFLELNEAAKMMTLPDPQVSYLPNVGDVFTVIVGRQPRLHVRACHQGARWRVCYWRLRVCDRARAVSGRRMVAHRPGPVARQCAGGPSCASQDARAGAMTNGGAGWAAGMCTSAWRRERAEPDEPSGIPRRSIDVAVLGPGQEGSRRAIYPIPTLEG